jgi:hypothetical protein
MTDAEQREAARQFVNRWMGKGKEAELTLPDGKVLKLHEKK